MIALYYKNKFFRFFLVFLIAFLFHFIFFKDVFISNHVIYSGKDMVRGNYAVQHLLYEGLRQGTIPLTTDKIFGLYPIFFGANFYNILNLISTYIFGPYYSIHFQILLIYFIGFFSLFYFLERYFKLKFLWKIILCYLYFFNFLVLYHYQHTGILYCIFLFPTIILLTRIFLEKRNVIYPILICLIYYLFVLSSAYQFIILNFMFQFLYIYFYTKSFKEVVKSIIIFFVPFITISLPTIYYFSLLYFNSDRSISPLDLRSSYDLKYFGLYLTPFFFGTDNYFGTTLSKVFIEHETLIYFSLSTIVLGLLILTSKSITSSIYSKFLIFSVILFFLVTILPIFPFDKFRYWVRGHYVVNFAFIIFIANFLSQGVQEKFSFKKLSILVLPLILFFINFIDQDFRFQFKTYILDIYYLILIYFAIFITTVFFYFKNVKYVFFILLFEILISTTSFNFNLTTPMENIEEIRNQTNNYYELHDDYSLLKKGPSLSYSGSPTPPLVPYTQEYIEKNFNLNLFLVFKFFAILLTAIFFMFINKYLLKNIESLNPKILKS